MKSTKSLSARERTRRAILEAMADVIGDANGIGFSVQAVADRAGVTHRTIYNHFPTRDALCEGFAAYVDEVLLESSGQEIAPQPIPIDGIPALTRRLYGLLATRERHTRAHVMLMIGNRQPLKAWRERSKAIERQIAAQAGPQPAIDAKLVTAAVRMFASTMGWHLLTEQCGLTTEQAAAASEWATRTLLDAAVKPRSASSSSSPSRKRGSHAARRRRA